MVSRQNIAILSGTETRMVELPEGKKLRIMFSGVDRISACDGRTDRHLATAYTALCIHVAR